MIVKIRGQFWTSPCGLIRLGFGGPWLASHLCCESREGTTTRDRRPTEGGGSDEREAGGLDKIRLSSLGMIENI